MKKWATRKKAAWFLACLLSTAVAGCAAAAGNADSVYTAIVDFSRPGGLYEQAFGLTLSTDAEEGIIRYTLDGSGPTGDSPAYAEAIPIEDRTDEPNTLSAITASFGGGGFGGGGNRGGGPGGNRASTAPTENVFKGTVVKAAVFSEDGQQLSEVCIQSYFVSEDIFSRYGSLPIVSIVTDAANLFDSGTGIYTNYNQSGAEWERAVYFEMFEPDGTEVIAQNMGVRVNGGITRSLAQKALRFYAKSDYDAENPSIEYELFRGLTMSYGDGLLTSFKRILLRSSGNDNSGTLFRDALMQNLVSDLNVDTQAARPCVAFINGEFWGIYNIRERYDDQYFATHYGIDKEDVAILELSQNSTPAINEGDESDLAYYNEMYSFFQDNSLADGANYQKAQEYIDIDNFIDYYIANIYSGNQDWPGNNNIFWRYRTENGGYDSEAVWYQDGRFRWMMKDMDWGFGLQVQVSSDTLAFALGESASGGWGGGMGGRGGGGMGFNADWSTLFFRRLIENESFVARFVNRFCDVMNTNYDAETVVAAINEYAAALADAMSEHVARYPGAIGSMSDWESNVGGMIQFAQARTGYVQGFLANQFSLGGVATVTLETDSEAGYIRINGTDIAASTRGVVDASSWSGEYFAGTAQILSAVPLEGHRFVKFIVTDMKTGVAAEYAENVVTVQVGDGGTSVQAVFE